MSRRDERLLLAAYDIPDDPRRDRLAKALLSYGDRVQYSVFLIEAAPVKLARLRRELQALMHEKVDSVLLCDLGPAGSSLGSAIEFLGRERNLTTPQSFIV